MKGVFLCSLALLIPKTVLDLNRSPTVFKKIPTCGTADFKFRFSVLYLSFVVGFYVFRPPLTATDCHKEKRLPTGNRNDRKPLKSARDNDFIYFELRLNGVMKNEKWCRGAELNCRHADFQSAALPTELPRQIQLGPFSYIAFSSRRQNEIFEKNSKCLIRVFRPRP
jgi:hypothetical protein